MVLVSKLSLHENPLKIKIYYQDSGLVFEETLENKQLLNRKYDFSTSEKGAYRIVLFSEGREFTKEFKI